MELNLNFGDEDLREKSNKEKSSTTQEETPSYAPKRCEPKASVL